ncbi:MAG: hypothetical protein H6Q33_2699 [Deltaproteobacteria bacterium]|nr:hypothetical protein [Deltaproteobacteria bacterium]
MHRRRWLNATVLLLALIAMAYGQYAIRRDPHATGATALFLLAAVVAAILLRRDGIPADQVPILPQSADRSVTVGAALRSVGGLLAIIGAATLLAHNWRTWFLPGWGLLLCGVMAMSFALRSLDPPERGGPTWSVGEAVALTVILALGTFLRFYRYSTFPDAFATHAVEEQETAFAGYQIITHGTRPWEFMLDHYFAALALALSNDPTFLTVRIPFTIVSTLTIVPVHLLLRQLVARPAALAGTFLFSVSSWNLIYSRCAHNIFLTNFLVIIILGLLTHFGRTRRLAGIPWAALLCGYTLYAYAGYRGTPLFALAFLGLLGMRDLWRIVHGADAGTKRGAARALTRDLVATAILVVIIGAVFAPVVAQLRADRGRPDYYFEAANRSLANKEYYSSVPTEFVRQRLDRIVKASRIFMHVGDGSLTFNAPDEPMLDPLTACCFVGGLFFAALTPWRRFHAFWLWMFVTLMLLGTVFVQNLDVRRLQGITVFVALFAAFFLERLWLHARQLPATVCRWGVPVVAATGALTALGWNYNVYFHKMAENPGVRQAFKNQYTAIIHYGHDHHDRRYILLLSIVRRYFDRTYYYRGPYAWLIDRLMRGRDIQEIAEVLPPHALPTQEGPLTIMVQEPYERRAVGQLLQAVYPKTDCRDFSEPDSPPVTLTACDLPNPPGARDWTSTLEARYWLGAEPLGAPFLKRREPFIAYATLPPQCYVGPTGPPACYADWNGTFEVPVDGNYRFLAQPRGRTSMEVRVDDVRVGTAPIHLSAGTHQVWVGAHLPREDDVGARLSWERDGTVEVVPFYTPGGSAVDNAGSS